jgi:hypothetical protein
VDRKGITFLADIRKKENLGQDIAAKLTSSVLLIYEGVDFISKYPA